MKPHAQKGNHLTVVRANGIKETVETGGINVEARIVISEDNVDDEMVNWIVENVKFSVKEPVIRSIISRNIFYKLISDNFFFL